MNMLHRYRIYPSMWAACAAASLLVFVACGDNGTTPPTTGSIQVTVATTGSDVDADGYTVQLDGDDARPVGANGSVSYSSLEPGSYAVSLTGLAANCSVTGSNPLTVTVTAGESTPAAFAVVCETSTGSIVVTATTSGDNIDPDGYTVLVDDANGQAIAVDGSATFENVVAGMREVTLDGLADDCSVSGDNPRTVTVPAGGSVETTFVVTCTSEKGTLEATTVTSGPDPDPDGYTLLVGTSISEPIGVNTTVSIIDVPAGDVTVELTGVASNCSVTGENPRTVTVPSNATVQTDFEVTCVAIVGSVEVTTSTTGTDPDPDGYTLNVEGATPVAIGLNETVTVDAVLVGERTVELTGLAANCSVTGENPRMVTVTDGETVMTTFDVDCPEMLSNQLVFESDRDGDTNIYVMDADGSNQTALTSDLSRDAEPYVSPDGTKIAFTSERDGDREIFVMDANGSNQTALTSNAVKDAHPAWSADGTKIAFQSMRDDANGEIYVMDADGSNVVRLTNDAGEDGLPSWSPDGTRIVFASNRGGNDDIYTMDSDDGGNLIQITSNAADDFAPAWSPLGDKIAFTSERDGNREIYTMNVDGTNLQRLTTDADDDLVPDWSPDGSQIAFTSDRDGDMDNEIWVMNANGSAQTQLTFNLDSDFEVSWSPQN